MYLLYAGGGSAARRALPHFAGRGNSEDLPGDGRAGNPEDQAYRRGAAGAAADAPAGGKTEKHAGDREGDSGLDGLNISLDTLDEVCSRQITRRDELGRTLEGISEALKYPEISLKINCVPLGIPEQDLCRVAFLAKDHKVHVRFIEMMPIGMGKEFHGVSEEELLGILGEKLPRFSPYVGEPLGNGPCHYYDVDGFSGKIGFISAVSHKFCGECNRIRLTSQGFLKTCLQYAAGRDLREVIRSGGSDEELKAVILEALAEKPDGHAFGGGLEKQKDDKTEKLCMAQIGG